MSNHPLIFCFGAVLTLGACVVKSPDKETSTTADTARAAPVVTVTPVNRATVGMRETVRWALSPDRHAILVIDDPVAVENDPIANAFFFGDEQREFQVQMDSVWDVSPSPDWKALGFGRAYTVQSGPEGEINLLSDVSRRTSVDTTTLRAGSFPSSGMVGLRAVAQPGVIRIPDNPRAVGAADSAAPKLFPIIRGWRVRWTMDGSTLALGNNPMKSADDEQSVAWSALDPSSGSLHGSLPANTALYEPGFTKSPAFELGTPTPATPSAPIKIDRNGKSYSIVSERGVITITETGSNAAPRVVGAGTALAATAGGRYVLAIAPKAKPMPNGMAVEPVVYTVTW